jgi:hypothetical protein
MDFQLVRAGEDDLPFIMATERREGAPGQGHGRMLLARRSSGFSSRPTPTGSALAFSRTIIAPGAPTKLSASRLRAFRAAAPFSKACTATSWSWRNCGRSGRIADGLVIPLPGPEGCGSVDRQEVKSYRTSKAGGLAGTATTKLLGGARHAASSVRDDYLVFPQ